MEFDSPLVPDVVDVDTSPISDVPELDLVEITQEDYLQKRINELNQMGINSYEDLDISKVTFRA